MPRPKDEPVWFDEQYQYCRPIVIVACSGETKAPRNRCEEATDDAFAKAWEKNLDFPNRRALIRWLRTVAANQITDERRRKKRQADHCNSLIRHQQLIKVITKWCDADEDAAADRAARLAKLDSAISKLAPLDREILSFFSHGMTDGQIAQRLELSRVTAHRRRHESLKRLKRLFGNLATDVPRSLDSTKESSHVRRV